MARRGRRWAATRRVAAIGTRITAPCRDRDSDLQARGSPGGTSRPNVRHDPRTEATKRNAGEAPIQEHARRRADRLRLLQLRDRAALAGAGGGAGDSDGRRRGFSRAAGCRMSGEGSAVMPGGPGKRRHRGCGQWVWTMRSVRLTWTCRSGGSCSSKGSVRRRSALARAASIFGYRTSRKPVTGSGVLRISNQRAYS